jgi:hypothetical protein
MFCAYYSGTMYKVRVVRCGVVWCCVVWGGVGWGGLAGLNSHRSPAPVAHAPKQAILAATQRSFAAIKSRVGSHASTGIFYLERPFFDVNVELKVGWGRVAVAVQYKECAACLCSRGGHSFLLTEEMPQ